VGVVGELLPVAIGLAMLGIMPMIAAVVLMSSDGGPPKAWAFVTGYFVALIVVTLLLVAAGQQVEESHSETSNSTGESVIQLLLGIVLLFLSYRNFRKRDAVTTDDAGPGWLKTVDKVSVPTALGLGFAAGAVNPKNLALIPGAAITIIGAGLTTSGVVMISVAFAFIGSCGLAIPLVIPLFAGERTDAVLASLRQWLTRNTAVIMMVLLFILGWVLIGRGLSGLGT